MDRTRVGFALVGVAALLWVAVNLMQGGWDALPMVGLLLMAAGAFVAAWAYAEMPPVGAAGLGVVVLGTLLFYDWAIFFEGVSSVAGGLFAIGAAVAAIGVARAARPWRLAGAVVAALGAAVWIFTDTIEWQPGNVLAAVAWAVVAVDAWRAT